MTVRKSAALSRSRIRKNAGGLHSTRILANAGGLHSTCILANAATAESRTAIWSDLYQLLGGIACPQFFDLPAEFFHLGFGSAPGFFFFAPGFFLLSDFFIRGWKP